MTDAIEAEVAAWLARWSARVSSWSAIGVAFLVAVVVLIASTLLVDIRDDIIVTAQGIGGGEVAQADEVWWLTQAAFHSTLVALLVATLVYLAREAPLRIALRRSSDAIRERAGGGDALRTLARSHLARPWPTAAVEPTPRLVLEALVVGMDEPPPIEPISVDLGTKRSGIMTPPVCYSCLTSSGLHESDVGYSYTTQSGNIRTTHTTTLHLRVCGPCASTQSVLRNDLDFVGPTLLVAVAIGFGIWWFATEGASVGGVAVSSATLHVPLIGLALLGALIDVVTRGIFPRGSRRIEQWLGIHSAELRPEGSHHKLVFTHPGYADLFRSANTGDTPAPTAGGGLEAAQILLDAADRQIDEVKKQLDQAKATHDRDRPPE